MPTIKLTPSPFVKFFSCVEGHIVSRYGSGSRGTANQRIGVYRKETSEPGAIAGYVELEWRPEEIVAITADEMAAFGQEYAGHVRDKSLVERTEAEWLAQTAAAETAAKELEAKASAEAPKTETVSAAPESDS